MRERERGCGEHVKDWGRKRREREGRKRMEEEERGRESFEIWLI